MTGWILNHWTTKEIPVLFCTKFGAHMITVENYWVHIEYYAISQALSVAEIHLKLAIACIYPSIRLSCIWGISSCLENSTFWSRAHLALLWWENAIWPLFQPPLQLQYSHMTQAPPIHALDFPSDMEEQGLIRIHTEKDHGYGDSCIRFSKAAGG